MRYEGITERIIKSAITVHTALGAGLLESTYSACLHQQFASDGLQFEHQIRLPVIYQGVRVEAGYRIDFLVENCVIVELNAVENLLPLHLAQILTYLRLSGTPVGLLITFNVPYLRQGIRRAIDGYQSGSEKRLPFGSSVSSVVEIGQGDLNKT